MTRRAPDTDGMGIFTVAVEVARVGEDALDFVSIGDLIVDTGSEVTWVRAEVLRGAGVSVRKKQERFEMANGDEIVRDVGYAVIRAQGFETIDEVVFALDNDLQLLGARTIEGFHARVDPERKRLVASGPIIAAQLVRR
jgi:predicted aspartyl protease